LKGGRGPERKNIPQDSKKKITNATGGKKKEAKSG
jgi:hypothetical protein